MNLYFSCFAELNMLSFINRGHFSAADIVKKHLSRFVNLQLRYLRNRYARSSTIERRYFVNYAPILDQMISHGERTAIVDHNGRFTYNEILSMAGFIGNHLKEVIIRNGANQLVRMQNNVACGTRVAFLCPNDAMFSAIICAIWQTGAIAVPLCKSHPIRELEYVISNSQASLILSTPEFHSLSDMLTKSLNLHHIALSDATTIKNSVSTILPSTTKTSTGIFDLNLCQDIGAMIVYTSGTTGRPKGVLTTHNAIR